MEMNAQGIMSKQLLGQPIRMLTLVDVAPQTLHTVKLNALQHLNQKEDLLVAVQIVGYRWGILVFTLNVRPLEMKEIGL